MDNRGWTSRGYLPHLDLPNLIQFVTYRLADSLPRHVLDDLEQELKTLPVEERSVQKRRRIEAYLQSGTGRCWLAIPEVAKIAEDALLATDGAECRLIAWTIMPNHVHALAELVAGIPLSALVVRWKGPSAFRANKLLGRSGSFWSREYYDRFMRNGEHLLRTIEYIDRNPVQAGLCRTPEEWPFGSARLGRRTEEFSI